MNETSKLKVVYIAGPFTGADGWEVACNVHRAEEAARAVAALGAVPLTPHSIGARMSGTETPAYWYAATLELMRRCDAVFLIPGWQRSTGARGEQEAAMLLDMPWFTDFEKLEAWVRGDQP